MNTRTRVLLVESEREGRETLASWIEAAGYDVTVCPGPSAPTYVCIGDRTGACPLVDDADVIVLDCRIDNDLMDGTSAADLLSLYVSCGHPVIALGSSGLAGLFEEDDVVFLDEGPPGHGLVETIDELAVREWPT